MGGKDIGGALTVTLPEGERTPFSPAMLPSLGRYQLHKLLGSGGMGAVFAAFDPELERVVAVKVLHPDVAGGEAAAELRREGQTMARLAHPNVIPVHDVGEAGGTTFVAMAYVHGGTLADWLARSKRSTAEILSAFRQAGRGLAAAHDAGLVHRDFKPSNALVADDGRVMVSDFGLALPVSTPPPGPGTSEDAPVRAMFESLRVSSSVIGTPAYMSPEQRLGRPLDARADQFSFCVALWYALYGRAPYAGRTGRELLDAALAGQLTPVPPGVRVPAPVHAALVRGLAADPEARFPTMHALLAALDDEAWRARRTRLWVAALLGGVMLAGFGLAWWWRGPAVATCDALGDRFAGVWDPAARAEVHRAFLASGAPYAAASFAEVARSLDARVGQWQGMRRESCLATRVRHEQSDAAMDLRAACLERRAAELGAFVELLRRADRAVVEKAVEAAGAVGQVASCADAAGLARRVPPPSDPARREEAARIERELARVRAAAEAGRGAQARAEIGPLVEAARALGHPPVLAEALFVAGRAALAVTQAGEAEKAYDEAVLAAEAAGDDALRLELEIGLTAVVGHELERDAEGLAHARRAEALLARLGAGPREQAKLARARAQVDWHHGRYAAALVEAKKAIALFEEVDPQSSELASAYQSLGVIHDDEHDDVEALAAFEAARAHAVRALGAEHPFTGRTWSSVGSSLRRLGRYAEAEPALREGLRIQELASGKDSPLVAAALIGLGNFYSSIDRPADALPEYARAAAIFDASPMVRHSHHGLALEHLGTTYSKLGRRAEAEAALRRAIEIHRARVGENHLATSTSLRKLGEHYLRFDDPARAVPLFEEAVASLEKSLGPDDENLARPYGSLGDALMSLKRYPEAARAYERALATVGDDDNDRGRKAGFAFALAGALVAGRGDRARARDLAGQARAIWLADGEQGNVAEVDAWLARHVR